MKTKIFLGAALIGAATFAYFYRDDDFKTYKTRAGGQDVAVTFYDFNNNTFHDYSVSFGNVEARTRLFSNRIVNIYGKDIMDVDVLMLACEKGYTFLTRDDKGSWSDPMAQCGIPDEHEINRLVKIARLSVASVQLP